jgi:hypothetical protein
VKSFEPIGTYDVVVDDGSHDPIDVQVAHAIVWPHVASGGLYVVEDLREEALGTIDEPLRGLFRRADLAEMFVHPSEVLYPWRQQIVFMRKT